MSLDASFSCDREFEKILARREDVDLTTAALELARDADPNLNFGPTLTWINERAEELAGPMARSKSDAELLELLGRCIAETHGIFGEASAFERPESSYLNRVIETKRGIPITLSLLYMSVARAAGIELQGVAAPMHFVARYESVDGPIFLDAFSRGRLLTEAECIAWLKELTGASPQKIRAGLVPVGPRPIIQRMLLNLKATHIRHEDWTAALTVQQRLAALQPSSYQERRDLGFFALKANRPAQAMKLFQLCLKACPSEDTDALQRLRDQAQSQLARWN